MRGIRELNVAVLLWVMATGAAFADQVVFEANLQPSSEVPPTTSKGWGVVKVTLDTSSKVLKWTGSYQGLTGPATMALHGPAPVGQNADVQVRLGISRALRGSLEGQTTLSDAQINELETGKWYVNVHTEQNPGGEIRGQLLPAR